MILGKYLCSTDAYEGGLARVVKAHDVANDRAVAVKFIEPLAEAMVTRELWELEYRILKKLSHRNVSKLIDAGFDQESQKYVIVLEFLETSLGSRLNSGWLASNYKEWKSLAKSIMQGVKFIHEKGVFHRDLKPDNLMFRTTSRDDTDAVIIDFNISKNARATNLSAMTMREYHTPVYSPPELDEVTDHFRDVWAIVVVLVQILVPQPIETHRQLRQVVDSLSSTKVVPKEIVSVLQEVLFPAAHQTINTLSDLQDALTRGELNHAENQGLRKGVINVRFTRNAFSDLDVEPEDEASALRSIQRSLEREAFISHPRSQRGYDQSKIWLVTHDYALKCGVDQSAPAKGLIVKGAKRQGFEEFDVQRGYSLGMPPYVQIKVSPHQAPPETNEAALKALLSALAVKFPTQISGNDFGSKLDIWTRTLEVREKFLLTRFDGVTYSDMQTFGERARARIASEIDEQLAEAMIGSYWELKDVKGGYLQFEGLFEGEASFLRSSARGAAFPTSGILVPSLGTDRASLQRQRTAVSQIAEETSANSQMAEYLNDLTSLPRFDPSVPEIWFEKNLDQNKRDAVANCLAAEGIYVVEGPPGTGKTTFITELIRQQLRRDPSSKILLVSQTHVAVDNALEKLDSSKSGKLLRIGRESNPKITVRHLFVREQMRLMSQKAQVSSSLFIRKLMEQLGLEPDLMEKGLAISRAIESLKLEADEDSSSAANDESLSGFVARTQGLAGGLLNKRKESGLSESQLLDLVRVGYGRTFIEKAGEFWFESELVNLSRGNANFPKALAVWGMHRDWINKYAEDKDLERRFLRNVDVVAGTCTGFLSQDAIKEMEFDLCIIDEASKATSTEALVPISRSNKVVLVGDTKQLPPQDDELMANAAILKENDLEPSDIRETLFSMLSRETPIRNKTTLTGQYRMVRPIGDMVSRCFYDGALVSNRESDTVAPDLGYEKTIHWLDTSSSLERFESKGDGMSKANVLEADLVVSKLKEMNDRNKSGVVCSVLVSAPYAAQVNLIRKKIAMLPLSNIVVRVDTFDAVQGLETDVAILSLTRSNVRGSYGFVGSEYWRRANVAASRARSLIVFVGDLEFAKQKRSSFAKLAAYVTSNPDVAEVEVCRA